MTAIDDEKPGDGERPARVSVRCWLAVLLVLIVVERLRAYGLLGFLPTDLARRIYSERGEYLLTAAIGLALVILIGVSYAGPERSRDGPPDSQ